MPRTKISNSYDHAAEAIHAFRRHTNILCRLGEDMTEQLNRLEDALRIVRNVDKAPELEKLATRLERLRECRNMMVLGGLHISLDNEIAEAWRRLP